MIQLSAIVATFNRRALLARTLPTILNQTYPADAYEVIVVVDGSSDGTLEFLGQLHPACRFTVITQPNRGLPAARNAGLMAAKGDLILFLDDDLLCEPNLVAEHIAAHRSGKDQVAFGPIYVSPESPPTLAARWTRWMADPCIERLRQEGASAPLDARFGANKSAPRATLIGLGGFDEGPFRHSREDLDFGIRLWLGGVSFRFHEAAVTRQVYIKSDRDLVFGDGMANGKSEIALYRKHNSLRRYSEFARYQAESAPKRLVKELAARTFTPFDRVARVPCWLANRFPRNESLETIGLRFLSARRSVVTLRSGVAETGGWRSFKREFGIRALALLYHNVGPWRPGTAPSLTVSPRQFETQIRWLKRHGYVAIRPSDWFSWCQGEGELPQKPLMLTFDDAYFDLATYALPILKKYGFTATIFVVTTQIGGRNEWDEKNGSAPLRCMTADQIRQWAREGIEFGAHSRTHPDLTTLDDERLSTEIEGSAHELSELLGTRARWFAYPYCGYSKKVTSHVEKVFDLAFTCDQHLNGLATDPHLLRRVMIRPNDTLLDLLLYSTFGHSPINRLRDAWHYIRPVRRPYRPKQATMGSMQ